MVNEKRIVQEFFSLVEFDSETYNERKIADYIIKKLKTLDLIVIEDNVGFKLKEIKKSKSKEPTGNIYAYLPGNIEGEPILLSAHLDTVSPGIGKKAVIDKEGKITSDKNTILGADDISGIVSIIEALTVIKEKNLNHPLIEVVFFVAEEDYGNGSRYFDYSLIKSKTAYVFDLTGDVGNAAIMAPTIISFLIEVIGKNAHAGFEPEKGINAIKDVALLIDKIKCGRIDFETTCNIGKISGGEGRNIIPGRVLLDGEIRSMDHDKALEVANQINNIIQNEKLESKVNYSYVEEIKAYKISEDDFVVKHFIEAVNSLGLPKPKLLKTLGGSDNNNLNKYGIKGIVISNAMNDVHTKNEYCYVSELVRSSQIVLKLITIDKGE